MSQNHCSCRDCQLHPATIGLMIVSGQFAVGSTVASYPLALAFFIAFLSVWLWRVRIGERIEDHDR